MTKFKKNDRVEITAYPDSSYNGFFGKVLEPLDQYGYVELALESVPVGYSEEWQAGSFYVRPNEITLAKQETKVTEFKAGDVVRVLRNRNGYGQELTWFKGEIGQTITLGDEATDINDDGELGDWTPFTVVGKDYWVRSDDIELVSRPAQIISNESGDCKINLTEGTILIEWPETDWESELIGNIELPNGANVKTTRIDHEIVSLKIKNRWYWDAEDLYDLATYITTLAEYLETGTVDFSDVGDCIECENEHLRDSNERLASANEAKRQRLAKIRELTEV